MIHFFNLTLPILIGNYVVVFTEEFILPYLGINFVIISPSTNTISWKPESYLNVIDYYCNKTELFKL